MAIGDAVAAFIGTAVTNRQPSSGVEEQISSILKPAATSGNDVSLYDGSNAVEFFNGASVRTNVQFDDSTSTRNMPFNMAVMITNSIYLRKTGTADRIYVGGVQTNA
jgi:hypothetical protein